MKLAVCDFQNYIHIEFSSISSSQGFPKLPPSEIFIYNWLFEKIKIIYVRSSCLSLKICLSFFDSFMIERYIIKQESSWIWGVVSKYYMIASDKGRGCEISKIISTVQNRGELLADIKLNLPVTFDLNFH